jgi:hypothetical protein
MDPHRRSNSYGHAHTVSVRASAPPSLHSPAHLSLLPSSGPGHVTSLRSRETQLQRLVVPAERSQVLRSRSRVRRAGMSRDGETLRAPQQPRLRGMGPAQSYPAVASGWADALTQRSPGAQESGATHETQTLGDPLGGGSHRRREAAETPNQRSTSSSARSCSTHVLPWLRATLSDGRGGQALSYDDDDRSEASSEMEQYLQAQATQSAKSPSNNNFQVRVAGFREQQSVEDRLAHAADPSRSNLGSALGLVRGGGFPNPNQRNRVQHHRVESSRASPPHRPRGGRLTHPADTSRSNLAHALGL